MKIAAGIDGGGTGTTLVLSDGSHQERKRFGAFNLNSIGEERFRGLLAELFDAVVQAGECEKICIGAAGISNPRVKEIILETEQGMLMIKGNDLHVSRLTLDKGEVDVDGRIDSFTYSEQSGMGAKGESFLSRLFK